MEDVPNVEEATLNYHLFTQVFGVLVGVLSRHYNLPDLKKYVESSISMYGISKESLQICINEAILENPDNFVSQMASISKPEPIFVPFKKISERKEVYPIEPLINICAEFMAPKVPILLCEWNLKRTWID